MNYCAKAERENCNSVSGVQTYRIFTPENTPISNSTSSLGIYQTEEYPPMGIHDDNEGFFVVDGHGKVQLGDIETDISPNMAFFAPAGVPHSIKKDPGSSDLKIFLYHFPKI
jgi:mannose-6-phosphate isomerase-like protein (cupin superfamily)